MAEVAVTSSPSGGTVTTSAVQKLPLFSLTAMVVGSMVGAGIFNLPGRFATATGPFGAIIAWAIAGTGMYMLARVFQALAEKRPISTPASSPMPRRVSATIWASCRPSAIGSAAASATSSTGC